MSSSSKAVVPAVTESVTASVVKPADVKIAIGFPHEHPPGTFESISTERLYNALQQLSKIIIFDLRSEEDYRNGHIPQSISVPLGKALNPVTAWSEVEALVWDETHRELLENIHKYEYVVVEREPAYQPFIDLLIAQHLHICWIEGGLNAFRTEFPFISIDGTDASWARGALDAYPSMIISNFLYLGNFIHALSSDVVRNLKITHIVDASNASYPGAKRRCFESSGVSYFEVTVEDIETANISEFFLDVFEFIEAARKAHGRVLVHCRAGISRSATLVIYYLMRYMNIPLKDAYRIVVSKRGVICPSGSFRYQLRMAEQQLRGSQSIWEEFTPQMSAQSDQGIADDFDDYGEATCPCACSQGGKRTCIIC